MDNNKKSKGLFHTLFGTSKAKSSGFERHKDSSSYTNSTYQSPESTNCYSHSASKPYRSSYGSLSKGSSSSSKDSHSLLVSNKPYKYSYSSDQKSKGSSSTPQNSYLQSSNKYSSSTNKYGDSSYKSQSKDMKKK